MAVTNESRMPVYRCKCGTKILIIPDLSAMKRALQAHLVIHKKITGQNVTEEFLAQEIIKVLSES